MVATRGCGRREAGGVYFCCPLSPFGKPVESFLIDAPIPMPKEKRTEMGVTAIGVHLKEYPGSAPYVFDWVGENNYPNVCDFIEEVKFMGMSRRVPVNFPFEKLRPGSRQVMMHARAVLLEPERYQLSRMGMEEGHRWCPKNIDEHRPQDFTSMCAGLWWEDVEGDEPGQYAADWPRHVKRNMPSFSYEAWRRPFWANEDVGQPPKYEAGLFMALPIATIQVIRDDSGGRHESIVERLRGASRLPVELWDE